VIELSGSTALVTGASRGIGAATARALDRAGARVVLTARTVEALNDVATTLANDPVVIPADLANDDGPAQLAARARDAVGPIDILVNNAALVIRVPSPELEARSVDEMLTVNVRNLLMLTVAVLPGMVERGGGSIVNITSVSGLVGTLNRSAYAASKGAVDAMTRSLAVEYGPRGIRVNAVAPGIIDTDLQAETKAVPGLVARIDAQIPLRRWGTASDVADVIVFLASDAARYITAQTISVDGGMGNTLEIAPRPD
jgi:NAD(P)-dependent dehydrogenase (short-subunit alcohol dehydrogenase family)